MSIRRFEPRRGLEIILLGDDLSKGSSSRYGSGYRIGGRLVLTAAHFLDDEGTHCKVRSKQSFGEVIAQVVWKASHSDIALVELPKAIADIEAITLGKLPDPDTGGKLAFQMYGYPRWARTRRKSRKTVAGGRQIEGIIYLADTSPDEVLTLDAQRSSPEINTARSEWEGISGAAIICDGLLMAVQHQHQNPGRPASLEATPLSAVFSDQRWRQLLERHGIDPEPAIARLQTAEKPPQILWHKVSKRHLEERLQLTSNPTTKGEGIEFQAEQVYVPSRLVEHKKIPRCKVDVSLKNDSRLDRESQAVEPSVQEYKSQSEPETGEVEVPKSFEHQQFLDQVLQQGQSPKSQGKRIAIIGRPGAGKTTLLQQIARWVLTSYSESLVIWVSLAELQNDSIEAYLERRWLQRVTREEGRELSDQDKSDLSDQFNQGHVWLLLDGLDELQVAGNPLSELQRQMHEGGWLQQARILVTCRINLWEGNRNALDTFDAYRTLEFVKPGQIEQFINKWFELQGDSASQWGQSLCDALRELGRKQVRDLVENPLRLTLLCFIWYLKCGRLPETQAELYQRFVERFYEWKAEEFPITSKQRQELNQALAQLSLAAIKGSGKEGKALFRFRHQFVQEYLSEPLFKLALKLGWLNQVGVDEKDPMERVYAFYHATFEEYFAALAIDDWSFFIPREHRRKPVKGDHHTGQKYKPYRIFEPQWKQVFLLWMGRQNKALVPQKNSFIQALINFRDGCGGYYRDRAFLLAAEGIAEFPDCTRGAEVIDRLMLWVFGHSNWLKERYPDWFESERDSLRHELALDVFPRTNLRQGIRALEQVVASDQDESIRIDAAKLLGQIDSDNETAVQFLEGKLESTLYIYTLCSVGEILSQISPGNETAILALAEVLESTEDPNLRDRAANGLIQVAVGNKTAIRALERILKSTQKKYTRWETANCLGQIDPGSETAIQTLVGILRSEPNRWIADDLVQIGIGSEATIPSLIQLLTSAQDVSVSEVVAESLEKIGIDNENVIQALIQVLASTEGQVEGRESTRSIYIRWRATRIIGKIGIGNKTAIQALVRALEFPQDQYISEIAAESLGQVDPGNKTAIQTLVVMLRATQTEHRLRSIAESLGKIGTGSKDAIQALELLLSFNLSEHTLINIAERLTQIDPGNETAIRVLSEMTKPTQDSHIIGNVIKSLGKVETGNGTAIQALLEVLGSNQDRHIMKDVIESLAQIGIGDETVIQALVKVLEFNGDEYVCQTAAENLGKIGMGNKTATQALVKVLEFNRDGYVLRSSIESLGKIGTGDKTVIQEIVKVLESNWDEYVVPIAAVAAESLGEIGMGSETAIQALARVIESVRNEYAQQVAAESLGKIGVGHKTAIQALAKMLESNQEQHYARISAAKSLDKIAMVNGTAIQALVAVLPYDSSDRLVYQLMVRCAARLSYPEFYDALQASQWHPRSMLRLLISVFN